jgi:photosystem II stability/assembly factor-like uncharacterized protein
MDSLSVAADGKFLYAKGTWLEAGELKTGVFRSPDLATTWCLLPNPEGPHSIAASPASAEYLFATRAIDDTAALELVKTSDGGITWQVAPLPAANSPVLGLTQHDPSVLFVLTANGAPWISDDAGDSWSPIDLPAEVDDSVYIFPAIFDPASPEYLAVIAVDDSGPAQRVFVTTDAGESWQESFPELGASALFGMVVGPDSALYVWSGGTFIVSVDWGQSWSEATSLPDSTAELLRGHSPEDEALYARAGSALWRSVDGGGSFESLMVPDELQSLLVGVSAGGGIVGQVPGAFTVTTDAGQSWEQRPLVPTPSLITQSPVEPWPLWSVGPNAYSDNGGRSWTIAVPQTSLPVTPDGKRAKAAFAVSAPGELRRTEDGGKSWSVLPIPSDVGDIHGVASCPAPHECLYLLYGSTGRPREGSALASDLARSPDAGRTWQASLPVPAGALYYPAAFAVAPDDPEQVVLSGDPGLVETRDGGHTWSSLEVPGAPRVGSVALFPGGVRIVASENLGVPADIVVRSTDDGASWTELDTDPGKLFVSHAHPDTAIVFGPFISLSKDRGSTWSRISPESDFVIGFSNIADTPDGRFIASADQLGFISFE